MTTRFHLGRRTLVAGAVVLVLAGCANQFSIHHKFKPDAGDSISIDAKQRAIYTVTKDFDPDSKEWKAICAEPSPDALTAMSVGTGIDAATLSKSLGIAYSGQEGAASIGLRTQTITILRDVMYRLCEGYASGALDEIGFARLHRRYQATVMGLLAVEQITGAIVAQQAYIGGNAKAQLGQSLAQITVMEKDARAKSVAAKATVVTAKPKVDATAAAQKDAEAKHAKALTDAGGVDTGNAVKGAQTLVDTRIKEAADAKTAYDKAVQSEAVESGELASLEALRKELDRAVVFSSVTAALGSQRGASSPEASASAVAGTVRSILETVVNRDYTAETCLDAVLSRTIHRLMKSGNPAPAELAMRYCAYALEVQAMGEKPFDATRANGMASARSAFNTDLQRIVEAARAASAPRK